MGKEENELQSPAICCTQTVNTPTKTNVNTDRNNNGSNKMRRQSEHGQLTMASQDHFQRHPRTILKGVVRRPLQVTPPSSATMRVGNRRRHHHWQRGQLGQLRHVQHVQHVQQQHQQRGSQSSHAIGGSTPRLPAANGAIAATAAPAVAGRSVRGTDIHHRQHRGSARLPTNGTRANRGRQVAGRARGGGRGAGGGGGGGGGGSARVSSSVRDRFRG